MTFREYLSQKFQEIYQGGDDGMSDAEDEWLTELHVDQVIEWAEGWGLDLLATWRGVKA